MGFVYVLKNPAMPKMYKVGMTTRSKVDERVRELNGATGVPLNFEVAYLAKTRSPLSIERAVHRRLSRYRVNAHREFFECSLWRIKRSIKKELGMAMMTDYILILLIVSALVYFVSRFELIESNELNQLKEVIKTWCS